VLNPTELQKRKRKRNKGRGKKGTTQRKKEVRFGQALLGFLIIAHHLYARLGYTDVLVVGEIDCGSWLAREYMPDHQHCGLFDILGCEFA